jgi:hypothetical protein
LANADAAFAASTARNCTDRTPVHHVSGLYTWSCGLLLPYNALEVLTLIAAAICFNQSVACGPGTPSALGSFAASMDLIAIASCDRVVREELVPSTHTIYKFTVAKTLKGPAAKTFLLRRNGADAMDEIGGSPNTAEQPKIRFGQRYLVFANRRSGGSTPYFLVDATDCLLELRGGVVHGITGKLPKSFSDIGRSLAGMSEQEAVDQIPLAIHRFDSWLREAKEQIKRQGG